MASASSVLPSDSSDSPRPTSASGSPCCGSWREQLAIDAAGLLEAVAAAEVVGRAGQIVQIESRRGQPQIGQLSPQTPAWRQCCRASACVTSACAALSRAGPLFELPGPGPVDLRLPLDGDQRRKRRTRAPRPDRGPRRNARARPDRRWPLAVASGTARRAARCCCRPHRARPVAKGRACTGRHRFARPVGANQVAVKNRGRERFGLAKIPAANPVELGDRLPLVALLLLEHADQQLRLRCQRGRPPSRPASLRSWSCMSRHCHRLDAGPRRWRLAASSAGYRPCRITASG